MSFDSAKTPGYEKKGSNRVGNHTSMALFDAQALGYNAVVSPVEHDDEGNASFTATHKSGVKEKRTYSPSVY